VLLPVTGWQLALVILSVTPLLAVAGGAMTTLLKRLATMGNEAYAGAGSIADETISNVRTVQAFNAEEREAARYAVKLEDAMLVGMRTALTNGATLGVTMFILFGCQFKTLDTHRTVSHASAFPTSVSAATRPHRCVHPPYDLAPYA
jgi:ABC-type bacteriocin/lantibiotic exporter with double-glycine peptidase domain